MWQRIIRCAALVMAFFIAGAITARCTMTPEPVLEKTQKVDIKKDTSLDIKKDKALDVAKNTSVKNDAASTAHTVTTGPTKKKKTKITKAKDGGVVIDIEEEESGGSTEKKEEQKSSSESKSNEVIRYVDREVIKYVDREIIKYVDKEIVRAAPAPRWHLQALVGTQPANDYKVQGGASVSYRVIGPWTLGAAVVAPVDSPKDATVFGSVGFSK